MKKRYIVGICLLAVLLALAERDVLSVYGSEDGVLNMGKYESNRGNLPETTAEILIPGGNHAFLAAMARRMAMGKLPFYLRSRFRLRQR